MKATSHLNRAIYTPPCRGCTAGAYMNKSQLELVARSVCHNVTRTQPRCRAGSGPSGNLLWNLAIIMKSRNLEIFVEILKSSSKSLNLEIFLKFQRLRNLVRYFRSVRPLRKTLLLVYLRRSEWWPTSYYTVEHVDSDSSACHTRPYQWWSCLVLLLLSQVCVSVCWVVDLATSI